MRQPDGEPDPERVELLLALTAATLRDGREQRRRLATLVLAVAVVCAAVAVVCAVLWLVTDRRADAIPDRALVRIDALNIEIPDPRPNLERGVLRLRALVYGVAGLLSAGVAALTTILWAVIRPSRLPPELSAAVDRVGRSNATRRSGG